MVLGFLTHFQPPLGSHRQFQNRQIPNGSKDEIQRPADFHEGQQV